MNRRAFLKVLAAIPFAGVVAKMFRAPEPVRFMGLDLAVGESTTAVATFLHTERGLVLIRDDNSIALLERAMTATRFAPPGSDWDYEVDGVKKKWPLGDA